ncbi:MAG TPA: FAD-dependent monooxygenase [Actinophytocola sp.]|nr:FAD-dependent monooxygenase [Actinophytocola sp.]
MHRNGFTPTVVERAPAIGEGGYKIDIRGAALTVVERMGVLDEIRRLRTDVQGASVVDAAGRRVASMDGDTFGGREHGDAEIMRGDLNRLLYDLTRDEVEYLFDDSIAVLEQAADGVEVTFASGTRRRFDLVVGADGLHSNTPRAGLRRRVTLRPGPGLPRVDLQRAQPSGPRPLGADLRRPWPHRAHLQHGTGHGREGHVPVQDRCAAAGPPRPVLAAARTRARAGRSRGCSRAWRARRTSTFDSLSQVHMDTWSAGRIGLVGDAAYAASPASGQGTSLALVGAYVLAAELAAANDHESAYTAYESRMRPFVVRNQALGPSNIKRMVMRTRTQVRLSMIMLGLMAKLPARDRLLAKVMAPIHEAANAIDLGRVLQNQMSKVARSIMPW